MTSDILCQGCNIIAIAQVGIDIGNTNIKACRMEVIDLEENPEVTVQHRAEQSQGLVVQGEEVANQAVGQHSQSKSHKEADSTERGKSWGTQHQLALC